MRPSAMVMFEGKAVSSVVVIDGVAKVGPGVGDATCKAVEHAGGCGGGCFNTV